jgi:DNA-binding XRE family transcriptional regulator
MMKNSKAKLTIRLKTYLEQLEVSAYTLGKWVDGVSPQMVYAIANGTRKPSIEALELIIQAFREKGFDTTLEDILELEIEQKEISIERHENKYRTS